MQDQNFKPENDGESVGSVANPSEAQNATTLPTNSTLSDNQRISTLNDEFLNTLVLESVVKFTPKSLLEELFVNEFCRRNPNLSEQDARLCFQRTFTSTLNFHGQNDRWRMKFHEIFKGIYPSTSREFYFNGFICQKSYPKAYPHQENRRYTYSSENFQPIGRVKDKLAEKLAPDTFDVEADSRGKIRVLKTAETVRFINQEKSAFLRSSLHEAVIFDRPVYRIKSGWDQYTENRLPRKTYAARILGSNRSPHLLKDFLKDLQTSFSWDHGTNSFVNYLGYLIQPMIVHLAPGQMPGYLFLGPTKSGKNFLAQALASLIYNRMGHSSVVLKKLPSSPYEMDVLLSSAIGSIYLVFDEVKNATDEELKSLDSFLTSERIQARKMRHGYIEVDNYFVTSLTSVHKGLTDETEGRMVKITLTESRPQQIAEFFERWKGYSSDLLAALFHEVNKVELDYSKLPKINDRRPGFNIVAYFIEKVFGFTPDYTIDANTNSYLDDICLMYEELSEIRISRGGRTSVGKLCEYLHNKHKFKFSRDRIINELNTSLGYGSTEKHPSHKETGYEAENGKHYHIKFVREGIKVKRWFIYVRCLEDKSAEDSFTERFGQLTQADQEQQSPPITH